MIEEIKGTFNRCQSLYQTREIEELKRKNIKQSRYKRWKPSSPKINRTRSKSTPDDDNLNNSSSNRRRKLSLFRKEPRTARNNSAQWLSLPNETDKKLTWYSVKDAINVISALKSPLARRREQLEQEKERGFQEEVEYELIEKELEELKEINPEAYSKVLLFE